MQFPRLLPAVELVRQTAICSSNSSSTEVAVYMVYLFPPTPLRSFASIQQQLLVLTTYFFTHQVFYGFLYPVIRSTTPNFSDLIKANFMLRRQSLFVLVSKCDHFASCLRPLLQSEKGWIIALIIKTELLLLGRPPCIIIRISFVCFATYSFSSCT